MNTMLQTALEAAEKMAKGEEQTIAEAVVNALASAAKAAIPGNHEDAVIDAEKAHAIEALAKLLDKLFDHIDGKVG